MNFKKYFTLLLILYVMNNSYSQNELPFSKIPDSPKEISSATITARMIQGVGFRYYWATEGLTEKELLYKPSVDAQSSYQTLEHIYELATTINNAGSSSANIRPLKEIPDNFEDLRKETLFKLEEASLKFLSAQSDDLNNMKLIFKRTSGEYTFPIWNLINGPISDVIYHTGQIISFRRTCGNPVPKGVNVFMGIKN
tara:strand:+ start:2711 stop:3301 length:591 start_codon:yes stop_codon:yes gene_type:complete